MSNNRVRGARKSQRNGKVFEKYVERSCIRFRSLGLADIKKTPEPMKPVGVINKNYGWFKAVYEKKAQPDFTGTLKGGQSVMIEAKHTDSTRMPFERIARHQATDLDSVTNLGGLALVLLSFSLKNFYCIEWTEWLKLKETTGKKSVNQKDLAPYEVDYKNGVIQFLTSKGTARAADESN